jgi:hypothetical protein
VSLPVIDYTSRDQLPTLVEVQYDNKNIQVNEVDADDLIKLLTELEGYRERERLRSVPAEGASTGTGDQA